MASIGEKVVEQGANDALSDGIPEEQVPTQPEESFVPPPNTPIVGAAAKAHLDAPSPNQQDTGKDGTKQDTMPQKQATGDYIYKGKRNHNGAIKVWDGKGNKTKLSATGGWETIFNHALVERRQGKGGEIKEELVLSPGCLVRLKQNSPLPENRVSSGNRVYCWTGKQRGHAWKISVAREGGESVEQVGAEDIESVISGGSAAHLAQVMAIAKKELNAHGR